MYYNLWNWNQKYELLRRLKTEFILHKDNKMPKLRIVLRDKFWTRHAPRACGRSNT
jgi:hypothetical protein